MNDRRTFLEVKPRTPRTPGQKVVDATFSGIGLILLELGIFAWLGLPGALIGAGVILIGLGMAPWRGA